MVDRQREGTRVRYALAGDDVLELWLALRDTSAERLAEVERAARDYLGEEVEGRVAMSLLVSAPRRRPRRRPPPDEFEAGHIDGALSIPLDELAAAPRRAPQRREVIAYCRGPFCVFAHEAVRRLRAAGRPARRLEDGWPEWKLAMDGAQH